MDHIKHRIFDPATGILVDIVAPEVPVTRVVCMLACRTPMRDEAETVHIQHANARRLPNALHHFLLRIELEGCGEAPERLHHGRSFPWGEHYILPDREEVVTVPADIAWDALRRRMTAAIGRMSCQHFRKGTIADLDPVSELPHCYHELLEDNYSRVHRQ